MCHRRVHLRCQGFLGGRYVCASLHLVKCAAIRAITALASLMVQSVGPHGRSWMHKETLSGTSAVVLGWG